MEKAKVYFSDLRVGGDTTLPKKLEKLIRAAGIANINFDRQFVAIKIHFGEPGNLAFLRPNYAKVLVDIVKSLGGNPFLTDCNTLYVGRRKNALDHIDAAYENGYSPFSTGCHVIIGDGLKGTDEALVPVIGGEFIKEAKIGQAIMDADVIISLNHFKGHEGVGFGGALKNLGMGCGSRAGKMEMHNAGKPTISKKLCISCGKCKKNCAHAAITIDDKAVIDTNKCVGCGRCIGACPTDAVYNPNEDAPTMLGKKIAEYTKAVISDRPNFHINLVIDVSPFCDCHADNDAPIVPDVGMFASFDPVALDVACADAVNKQPPMPDSLLGEAEHSHHDHFTDVFPDTDWRATIDHSVKLGIGSDEYEIIVVK